MQVAQASTTGEDLVSSSKERILKTAKGLFAAKGYEHATTSAIARLAGTSETQMVKYFANKHGLLEAIFTAGWQEILVEAGCGAQKARSPAEKLGAVLQAVQSVMLADPEFKLLMLLEGRRIRKEGPFLTLSETFLRFVGMLDDILCEMQALGTLRTDLNLQAVRSALMGMMEGLLRDNFLAQRAGYPAHYSGKDMETVLSLVLRSFGPCENAGTLGANSSVTPVY